MEQAIYFGTFSLLVLLGCVLRPNAGRIFLGIFFLVMAVAVNIVLAFVAPQQFVALGTDSAIVPLYRWFFDNVVAVAPPVFGVLAAAYEIAVGVLILQKGWPVKWGLIGGIVFLVLITPLGIWTLANPILALALAYLLTQRFDRSFLEMLSALARRPGAHAPSPPPTDSQR